MAKTAGEARRRSEPGAWHLSRSAATTWPLGLDELKDAVGQELKLTGASTEQAKLQADVKRLESERKELQDGLEGGSRVLEWRISSSAWCKPWRKRRSS